MSFTWIEGTAVGDIIHKADIDEIKTNIDSIKDNLANITHDAGVLSTHRGIYLLNNYTNHNTEKDFSDFATHDTTEKNVHYTGDNSSAYTTHLGTNYTGDDAIHQDWVLRANNSGIMYTYDINDTCTSYYSSKLDPDYPYTCSAFNSTEDGNYMNPCISDNWSHNYYENTSEDSEHHNVDMRAV